MTAYNDLVSNVVPSMAVIVKHLTKAKKSCLDATTSGSDSVSLFRWLLRLTTLTEAKEDNENTVLLNLCCTLLNDVTLPDPLVDDVLECWCRCMYNSKKIENDSQLTEEIIQFCQVLEKQDPLSIAREPVEDETEEDIAHYLNTAIKKRFWW